MTPQYAWGGSRLTDVAWGDAAFVGDWTLEEIALFVSRVAEIQAEEHARAAEVAP